MPRRRASSSGDADDATTAANNHDIPDVAALGIAEPPEGWDGPRAVAYTAPQALPDPAHDLSDPDLPYWLALSRVKHYLASKPWYPLGAHEWVIRKPWLVDGSLQVKTSRANCLCV